MTEQDVEIIAREQQYGGYAKIDRITLRHSLFAGGWSRPLTRELIERGHAVAVLPYDPVRDEVILIKQFRMGAWGAGEAPWMVETVAGIIEQGEQAEDVARRETMEETGCTLGALHRVCDYFASPGIMTEKITVYCGITDTKNAGGIFGLVEEGEDIQAYVAPWDDIWTDVNEGNVVDAKIMLAMMWLSQNKDSLITHSLPPKDSL
ncbi:MAG: NUDIX domain-containing protein [Rhodospirillaceae bacterium]|jgi:ADP-ribose pyrophosphatase|nr:NUDIX domain-containing protein [Rhodospirillaceae bacterium]MBT5457964.1 NUDIX domain-containing protein [Rhodospirillaceae bacterium]